MGSGFQTKGIKALRWEPACFIGKVKAGQMASRV